MLNGVKILFTNKSKENTQCFTNVLDFISWTLKNNNQEIIVQSEIENIKPEDIKNLYEFLMFYKNTKEICNNQAKEYDNKLLNQNYEEIKEAAEEFVRVNQDGKYLRASLVGLGYQTAGKQDDNYKHLSAALEIFQTSILIHDDIIDNAKLRRGKDTIPVSYQKKYSNPIKENDTFETKKTNFSNSMGICVGDLGFYIANQIIVKSYKENPYLANLLEYYNEVVIKTCHGEMLDVILPFKEEYFKTTPQLEDKIIEIAKLKTAWYSVIGPYCLGLILGGIKENQIKIMEEILLKIGVAFQIEDDILGIYGDEKQLGKSITSDPEEYKQTILYSYTIKTNYKEELQKYYGKKLTKQEIDKVKEIFEKSGAKKYAENKMEELFQISEEQLNEIDFIDDKNKNILKGFIIYLKHRVK